jgi:CO/xanthine dehydrogenase FAD-binding subunit
MSRVILPTSLNELWRALERHPEARVYAGGTDLLVRRRQEPGQDLPLICLERIVALRRIATHSEEIFLGAGCTHSQLLSSPLVQDRLPILAQALAVLGSPLIRNVGTIGGNIVTASPAGDTLPPLYALNASLEIISPGLTRRLPIQEFIKGPGQTALRTGEILSGVVIGLPAASAIQHFEKVGQRAALAISVASLAALVQINQAGIVQSARLAWGSVGPTVITSPAAEEVLEGRPLDRRSLGEAAELARAAAKPISDLRASAAYRSKLAGNLLLRLDAN